MKLVVKFSSILSAAVLFSMLTSCSSNVVSSGGDLAGIVAQKSIVIGTNAEYPPFEFVGCKTKILGMCFTSEIQGLDVEVTKLIGTAISESAETTVKVTFKNMDFDGLIGALQAEQIDMIAAAFSVTPERAEIVDFSNVYYLAQTVLVVPAASTIASIEDLEGLRLDAQLGTVQEWMATDVVGETGTVNALADLSTLVLDVLAGNSAGLLVEAPVAENIILANSGLKIVEGLQFADDSGYAFAVLKGREDLLAIVNEVIATITEDGSLYQLYIQAVEDAAQAS